MPIITVGIVYLFAPFNFMVLLGLQNKGHANIMGFTVIDLGQCKDITFSMAAV